MTAHIAATAGSFVLHLFSEHTALVNNGENMAGSRRTSCSHPGLLMFVVKSCEDRAQGRARSLELAEQEWCGILREYGSEF